MSDRRFDQRPGQLLENAFGCRTEFDEQCLFQVETWDELAVHLKSIGERRLEARRRERRDGTWS